MDNKQLATITNAILQMNSEELDSAINTIRYRRDEINKQLKNEFQVGDRVSFEGKKGVRVFGLIEKKNRKKMVVADETQTYSKWTVPPSMLTKEGSK